MHSRWAWPCKPVLFACNAHLRTTAGIWSQIKRAPQSSKKRKVYEVDGPARPSAMPMDDRARQIFQYFKKYNYSVKNTGEVITFSGMYAADKGAAAAVTFYTFVSEWIGSDLVASIVRGQTNPFWSGMASVALVLSTLYPEVGNWWYALTLLSPGAWFYYFARGTREEEVRWEDAMQTALRKLPRSRVQMKVKMVTSDDNQTTDIVIEGDIEEITRFQKVREFAVAGQQVIDD